MIYLHRRGSLLPFTRHISPDADSRSTLDLLRVDSEGTVVMTATAQAVQDVVDYHFYKQRNQIISLPFTSVQDYLELLELSTVELAPLGPRLLTYLAAAVSDFYLPHDFMAEHKIQSTDTLKLELFQVPKLLGRIKHEWAPLSFLVSFKLETDHNLVIPKARKSIVNYGVDLVIANELHSRRDKVFLVTKTDCAELVRPPDHSFIEVLLVQRVSTAHAHFALRTGETLSPIASMKKPIRSTRTRKRGHCLLTGLVVSCAFSLFALAVNRNI